MTSIRHSKFAEGFDQFLRDVKTGGAGLGEKQAVAMPVLLGALAFSRTPLGDAELCTILETKLRREKLKSPIKLVRQCLGKASPYVMRDNKQYKYVDGTCKQIARGHYPKERNWFYETLAGIYRRAWISDCEHGDKAVNEHARTEYPFLLMETNKWSELQDHVYSHMFRVPEDVYSFMTPDSAGPFSTVDKGSGLLAELYKLGPVLGQAIACDMAFAFVHQVQKTITELKNVRNEVEEQQVQDTGLKRRCVLLTVVSVACVELLTGLLALGNAEQPLDLQAEPDLLFLTEMVASFETDAWMPMEFFDYTAKAKASLSALLEQGGFSVAAIQQEMEYGGFKVGEAEAVRKFREYLKRGETARGISFLEDVYAEAESEEEQAQYCFHLGHVYYDRTGIGSKAKWFYNRAYALSQKLKGHGKHVLTKNEMQETMHVLAQLSASEEEYDAFAAAMYACNNHAPLIIEQLPEVLNARTAGKSFEQVRMDVLRFYKEAVDPKRPREDYGYGPTVPPGYARMSCSATTCVLSCILSDAAQNAAKPGNMEELLRVYVEYGVLDLFEQARNENEQPDDLTIRKILGNAVLVLEKLHTAFPDEVRIGEYRQMLEEIITR